MLITTIISLLKRIISFGKLNRKSIFLMTRHIEERWIVVSQRFVVKRLEFMFRVVREEGDFLVYDQRSGVYEFEIYVQ
jgi:hypothetical protein